MEYQALDLLIAFGLTMRLTRLVVKDDLGKWYLQGPAYLWANRASTTEARIDRLRLTSGLQCPFCIGFWIGCLVLVSLWAVGGPGHAAEWWRWVAGVFAWNWATGHTATRTGDVD